MSRNAKQSFKLFYSNYSNGRNYVLNIVWFNAARLTSCLGSLTLLSGSTPLRTFLLSRNSLLACYMNVSCMIGDSVFTARCYAECSYATVCRPSVCPSYRPC